MNLDLGNRASKKRVLVVDDDRAVCILISDIVEDVEMEVLCAINDAGAYAMIDDSPALDALIVDVDLGYGTTGFDVARYARHKIPDVRVVYISGQSDEASLMLHGVVGSAFLTKPFSPEALLSVLPPSRANRG